MLSSCCLESPTAILPPLPPDCGMIFKFATRKTANIADTNTKCKIWVWNARLENLPIFAESLEQPAHISQLKNTEIQKYLYIWIYTMAYDIFIVSVCLHLKKWIWEEILSRESGGKWNLKQNGGTKQNLYKNGTNITYLLPLPFKIKSNWNLQISSSQRRCSAHVWHNMCNSLS